MAFNGFFQALPQVVTGARHPVGDVGMAMRYLGLGEGTRTFAAIVALASVPPIAWWLARSFLATADEQSWARHVRGVTARGRGATASVALLSGAVLALLFAFQVLLRPGVRFH